MAINLGKLSEKFREEDIEWRVQQAGAGNSKPWALIIPYITSRAIQQRLDDVCGLGNWKNEFKASPCGKGYLCGISIKIDNEWVTRWDGAELGGNGGIDPVKTTISNSMKRTGVQWSIGRYLYQFDTVFADCEYCDSRFKAQEGWTYQYSKGKSGKEDIKFQWKAKPLPKWAKPTTPEDIQGFADGIEQAADTTELKRAFNYAYHLATSENDAEMLAHFTALKDAAKAKFAEQENAIREEISAVAVAKINAQIDIIMSSPNAAVVATQVKLAMAVVGQIISPEEQANGIALITLAQKERLEELEQEAIALKQKMNNKQG